MRPLILGTRGSALALWQAGHVAERLRAAHPGLELTQRVVQTEGDRETTRQFGPGDRGVFVRDIERRLMAKEIDLAVHSLKDLPTRQPDELLLGAIPLRHDARDVLLSSGGWSLDELPQGSVVATGSPRRRAQILHRRPDLDTVPVRGNVDTRVRKLSEGGFDALMLALAGIERLGIARVPARPIPLEDCIPAVGQGALAIEVRADDDEVLALVGALDHTPSRVAVAAERAFLRRLGGGCLAPAAAHARVAGERVELHAAVGDGDGKELLVDRASGAADDAQRLGSEVAERMIRSGAERLLGGARDDGGA
ncbi:MAG: hydroxymethylbilane synthase [bacterium]|nr:hydroxymethylbilane synthase [bacterium]